MGVWHRGHVTLDHVHIRDHVARERQNTQNQKPSLEEMASGSGSVVAEEFAEQHSNNTG